MGCDLVEVGHDGLVGVAGFYLGDEVVYPEVHPLQAEGWVKGKVHSLCFEAAVRRYILAPS